jgi:hypothetical protein
VAGAKDGRQAVGGRAEPVPRLDRGEWEQPSNQSDGSADREGNSSAGLDDAER